MIQDLPALPSSPHSPETNCSAPSARRVPTTRLVRVAHDGCTTYARCRYIGDKGVLLSMLEPLMLGERVEVSFSPRVTLSGHVAWTEGTEYGIIFDREIDCLSLLASTALEARAEQGVEIRADDCRAAGSGTRPDHNFQPGLRVTMMSTAGAEKRALLDWEGAPGATLPLC